VPFGGSTWLTISIGDKEETDSSISRENVGGDGWSSIAKASGLNLRKHHLVLDVGNHTICILVVEEDTSLVIISSILVDHGKSNLCW
jgi:predicted Zn-dependent protease